MEKFISFVGKKHSLIIFIVFSFIYSLFLLGIFMIYTSDMIEKIHIMNLDTSEKSKIIDTASEKINELKIEVDSSRNSLNNKMGLFLNDQEIEEFYEEISNLSLQKEMTMRSLVRGETEEIENKDKSSVNQFKVRVSYELEGSFIKYLSLREKLASLEKVIIFESEIIERSTGNDILATASISIPKMVFGEEN